MPKICLDAINTVDLDFRQAGKGRSGGALCPETVVVVVS